MKIIGLTGPSGAGKGTLAAFFKPYHIPVIDADRVYHELLLPPSPCLDELAKVFGAQILTPEGTLDRTRMAALVFSNEPQAKERHNSLNRITHRYVCERIETLIKAYKGEGKIAVVIDAPLLIEAGLNQACDLVVAVLADREVRLSRLAERDEQPRETLLARVQSQPDDSFYRERADIVIQNDGSAAALCYAVNDILERIGVTS